MSLDKHALPQEHSPRAITDLLGTGAVISAHAYRHGVVTVVELAFGDSITRFLKFASNGCLEVGGTAEMNTGTKVSW